MMRLSAFEQSESEIIAALMSHGGTILGKGLPKPPISTTRVTEPEENLKPGLIYRELARKILAGERVEVQCCDEWSVMRFRSGIRPYVAKAGKEMRSTKLGNTLWMELKA